MRKPIFDSWFAVVAIGGIVFAITTGAWVIGHSWSTAPASTTRPADLPRGPGRAPIMQLTHDPGAALWPTWSPDEQLIAFGSTRDGPAHIYVMNADGSNVRAVTAGSNDDRHPFWTRDGRSIVYDSTDGALQEIFLVDLPSGRRTQLTHTDGLADFAAPSPDGKQIAYYVYKDLTLEIWSAAADGRQARALTKGLANARDHESTMAWHQPGWSPDSRWITFTGGDGKSIWVMRADGSNASVLISDGETNHFPWFTVDGGLGFIAEYVPPRYGASWTNAWEYNVDSGQRALLLQRMSMQGPMEISGDNSRVLFSSPRGGHFDVYVIDLSVPGGLQALQGTLDDGVR